MNCHAYHHTGDSTQAVEVAKKTLPLLPPNNGQDKSTRCQELQAQLVKSQTALQSSKELHATDFDEALSCFARRTVARQLLRLARIQSGNP